MILIFVSIDVVFEVNLDIIVHFVIDVFAQETADYRYSAKTQRSKRGDPTLLSVSHLHHIRCQILT
jgi:hypothetical protein